MKDYMDEFLMQDFEDNSGQLECESQDWFEEITLTTSKLAKNDEFFNMTTEFD